MNNYNFKEMSKEEILNVLKENIWFLKDIDNKEVQLEVVKQDGLTIRYINNPSEEIQLEALRRSGIAIKYIENPSEYIKSIIDIIETSKRTVYVLHEPNKKPLFSIGCQCNITKETFINRIYNTNGGLEQNPHRQEYLDILNRY